MFLRRHSIDSIKSINLKMNYFFRFSKTWLFSVLQFLYILIETFSASKKLEIYSFLDKFLQKYALFATYKSYRITDIFGNLYAKDLFIFSFNSQVYTDRLIFQKDFSLYLKYIFIRARGQFCLMY